MKFQMKNFINKYKEMSVRVNEANDEKDEVRDMIMRMRITWWIRIQYLNCVLVAWHLHKQFSGQKFGVCQKTAQSKRHESSIFS